MDLKSQPNHQEYLLSLSKMSDEKKLQKALELSLFTRQLFLEGLKETFPEKTEIEIKILYLQRLNKCYNRNY